MKLGRLIMVVLAIAIAVGPALAGNSARQGTAGAQELLIPVSARGIALGNGYIADVSGAEATFYNPAGVAVGLSNDVYASRMNWIADMHKNFVAGSIKTGVGTIGFMVDVLQVGEIEETTETEPEGTGRTFSPNFSVLGVTFSRFLTDAVSAGITAKVINESVLQVSATGVAFDAGLRYQPGWKTLRMTFLLKNFGPEMNFSGSNFESFHEINDNPASDPRSLSSQSASHELPSTFQIGLAYRFLDAGDNAIEGYSSFVNHNFGDDEFQFGAEYRFRSVFAVRGGYVATPNVDYNFGPSFGVGFSIPMGASRLNLDYGHRLVKDYFDDNQILSIGYAF